MKHRFMIAAAVALSAAGVIAQEQGAKPDAAKPASDAGALRAYADIKGEGITGRAELTERPQGTGRIVDLAVIVTGLKPGLHGIHLHAVGKCTPDFAAAGGHFDPGPAGNMDPDANHPFHMGDLPNIEVSANGRGAMKVMTTRVTLSDGPVSLLDADGSAIIIHGNPDQMKTGEAKSGVSGGPRLACGVIAKR
jgi:Cu-Zn family superoxide dismutase